MLGLPFAVSLEVDWTKEYWNGFFIPVIVCLISFNLFQHWQYKNGWFLMMEWTKGITGLDSFATESQGKWWANIQQPDYDRARAGYLIIFRQHNRTEYIFFRRFWTHHSGIEGVTDKMKKDGNYSMELNNLIPYSYPTEFYHTWSPTQSGRIVFCYCRYLLSRKINSEELYATFSTANDTGSTQYFAVNILTQNTLPVKNGKK